MNSSDIDLVYCWCDGSDQVWQEKRRATAARLGVTLTGAENGDCRCTDNDDLLHSLRSADLYAPWIRKVFVVMDDDARPPRWLGESGRLQIVRHSAIMPAANLPCFNSMSIENFLYAIPGLSERFLYANDDMMFNRPAAPDFFFARDGYPICRYGRSHADEESKRARTPYLLSVARAEDLLLDRFGLRGEFAKAYRRVPHHNIDAYLRSDYEACRIEFGKEIDFSASFPFRGENDVERTLYMGYALCRGRGHFRKARMHASLKCPWYRRLFRPGYADSFHFFGDRWATAEIALRRFKPTLFCFNDGEKVTAADRAWLKKFYARRFPEKSGFEK